MCGIAGICLRAAACDPQVLARMRDILAHRGPDDAGNFIEGPLGLGHRRLSIIDLGTGHQPMSSTDGRYTIVFNGEIYNYREWRRELEAEGAISRSLSDTEAIVQTLPSSQHLGSSQSSFGVLLPRLLGVISQRQKRRRLLCISQSSRKDVDHNIR